MTQKYDATDGPAISNINFFEVDAKTNRFYRVYADLIALKKHRLVIKLGEKRYVLRSSYNLPEFLRAGNVLDMFAYCPEKKKKGKFSIRSLFSKKGFTQLYPLPENRAIFDPDRDLMINYDYRSKGDIAQLINNNAGLRKIKKRTQEVKRQIEAEMEFLREHSAEAIRFAAQLSKQGGQIGKHALWAGVKDGEEDFRIEREVKEQVLCSSKRPEGLMSKKDLKKLKKKRKKIRKALKKKNKSLGEFIG